MFKSYYPREHYIKTNMVRLNVYLYMADSHSSQLSGKDVEIVIPSFAKPFMASFIAAFV